MLFTSIKKHLFTKQKLTQINIYTLIKIKNTNGENSSKTNTHHTITAKVKNI